MLCHDRTRPGTIPTRTPDQLNFCGVEAADQSTACSSLPQKEHRVQLGYHVRLILRCCKTNPMPAKPSRRDAVIAVVAVRRRGHNAAKLHASFWGGQAAESEALHLESNRC